MNLADRYIMFLEAHGLRVGWPSFARMLVAMLAAVVAVSWVLPDRVRTPEQSAYVGQINSPSVHEIGADRGDERGFFPSAKTKDQYRIAWIGGSSLQGVDPQRPTFAPAEFQRRVSRIDGRDVLIDLYFLSGMRIVDQLAAVQMAVDSDPDMVIVTLNPLWVLNDRAVHGWSNLDGRWFANSIGVPRLWPLTASFVGPSPAAWGALGSHVEVIEDRYDWGVSLKNWLGDWSPLSLQVPDQAEDESKDTPELVRIAQMQLPVFFWDTYDPVQPPVGTPVPIRQAAALNYEADNANGVPSAALRGLFGTLAASEVPSFVYVAQIDDEAVASPEVDEALARVEALIDTISDDYRVSSLEVHPKSVIRDIGDMNFKDIVHVYEIEPLVDYLTPRICDFVDRQELESSCGN